MGNIHEGGMRLFGSRNERGRILGKQNGNSSALNGVFRPDINPHGEPVIGAPQTEFLIVNKWSSVVPIEESDVRPLIEAFKDPNLLKTVYNDTFNGSNIPRNWNNSREVDRFAAKAKEFWMPKNPVTVRTIIPSIEGEEPPKNTSLRVNIRSFVVKVDNSPVHVFRIMDNDPYASKEERDKIDKEKSLRIAHQESMITLPKFQRQGIAAFGAIQTYDALLGKHENSKPPFDRVTMLINLAESNTANFFMNHGFEIFNLRRMEADETGEFVSQSVIRSNQDGQDMRMMRLILTQKRWHGMRAQRIERLKSATGIDLS